MRDVDVKPQVIHYPVESHGSLQFAAFQDSVMSRAGSRLTTLLESAVAEEELPADTHRLVTSMMTRLTRRHQPTWRATLDTRSGIREG